MYCYLLLLNWIYRYCKWSRSKKKPIIENWSFSISYFYFLTVFQFREAYKKTLHDLANNNQWFNNIIKYNIKNGIPFLGGWLNSRAKIAYLRYLYLLLKVHNGILSPVSNNSLYRYRKSTWISWPVVVIENHGKLLEPRLLNILDTWQWQKYLEEDFDLANSSLGRSIHVPD